MEHGRRTGPTPPGNTPPGSATPGPAPSPHSVDPARWVVLGDLSALDAPAVALVGTRSPRASGPKVAAATVRAAQHCGAPLALGLAAGVDEVAHAVARELQVPTVAWSPVHESHLSAAYRRCMDALLARPGCAVVLPADDSVGPCRESVEARNLAMVASAAVLVVAEARVRSLSLHAAACAVSLHRALVVPATSTRHRSLASVAGCRLLADPSGTTAGALGWPAELSTWVDRHAPVANAVCETPAALSTTVSALYRLAMAPPD